MKIRDFMITEVICTTKDATIKELLETLVKHKIGGVPVIDQNNNLMGMVTDGDVIRYLQPKGRTVYDMFSIVLVSEKEELQHKLDHTMGNKVEQMMRKKEIHKVHPNDEIEEAISIFSKFRFKKIPVVENNKVVGVVSRGDVIRYISTKLITETK